MKAQYGVDAMPETGENVAEEFQVSRADQDAFALRSHQRAANGMSGRRAIARRIIRNGIDQQTRDKTDGCATRTFIGNDPWR